METWRDEAMFENRRDAGRKLAERLKAYRGKPVIVVGLPRGGVEVAYEVARELGAPLDVIVARKLGAPGRPELGVGAIAPGGVRILDQTAIAWLRITAEELEEITARETVEMERRIERYHAGRPGLDVAGKTVILVDDGLATGGTARAAIASLKLAGAREIVLAVPVCAPEAMRAMRDDVDEAVCVETPADFRAVGYWYRNFDQTTDEEVLSLLNAEDSRVTSQR